MKLLIVGLDAADYCTTLEFIESLPNLSRLRHDGVFGLLKSHEFPTSPAAWCSVYTGCEPEVHGIEGFRTDGIATLRVKPFWDYLDCKIGLVNLPCVSARENETLDGFIVPGFAAPFKPYPLGLPLRGYVVDSIRHQQGRLRWLLRGPKKLVNNVKEAQIAFLEFNRKVGERRVDKTFELLNRFPVDVLFIGLTLLDRVGHGFAHHKETMLDIYRTAGGQIKRLIDACHPENIIVFSDHGMDIAESARVPQSILDDEARALRENPYKLKAKGLHTRDGILFLSGQNIRVGDIEGAKLMDIAPTILSLFGVDVPEYMSGKILDVFTYTLDEEVQLVESLKALGYC